MIDNGYHIIYDSDIGDEFNILEKCNGKSIAKFTWTPEGLYAFRPPYNYFEKVAREKTWVTQHTINN